MSVLFAEVVAAEAELPPAPRPPAHRAERPPRDCPLYDTPQVFRDSRRKGLRPPRTPTLALPGTRDKVAVLRRRFAKRTALWHEGDVRLDRLTDWQVQLMRGEVAVGKGRRGKSVEKGEEVLGLAWRRRWLERRGLV